MAESPLYALILFIVFILANALMHAFCAAIQCLNESELERKAKDGKKKESRLLHYMQKPEKLIVTVHLLTGFLAVVVGKYQLESYADSVRSWLVQKNITLFLNEYATIPLTYLVVAIYLMLLLISLGIYVPKRIGRRYHDVVAQLFVGPVDFIVRILTPFTALITFFSNLILKIIGIDPQIELNVTEEEIINIVNEGHEQGILEEREAEMISNIIELDGKTAGDIMTHRKNIVAIDGTWTLLEAVSFIASENNSRYPVYLDDIDNVIGILHIKEALTCYHQGQYANVPVSKIPGLLRVPDFIPESRNLNSLFKEMQTNKNHMDIVVDEYGQTAGLIAMEDILEEIVGNILDEHDVEDFNIIKESENHYLVKGFTTLEELQDTLGIHLEQDEFDTLNGYLIAKLDRIPAKGEKPQVEAYGWNFRILEVDGKVITRIEITKKEETKEN